jgi:hypothetical protein
MERALCGLASLLSLADESLLEGLSAQKIIDDCISLSCCVVYLKRNEFKEVKCNLLSWRTGLSSDTSIIEQDSNYEIEDGFDDDFDEENVEVINFLLKLTIIQGYIWIQRGFSLL